MAKKRPTPRKHLNKQRILDAAIAYADEHGVEVLTMRKIADELKFGVMTLYNYVSNKEKMLAEMVDVVVGEIDPPEIEGNWKIQMHASAEAAHKVLLEHPWVPEEWSRRMPGPNRIHFMNSILKILTEAKLSPDLVYHGYHAITMHIVGFTLQEIAYNQILKGDFEHLANKFLESLSGNYPYMADHVRAHLNGDCNENEFGFVLDLILDGLARSGKIP